MSKDINESIFTENDEGFSLLEVLIALVILSVSSLALFQSMSQMLRVTSQASAASDAVVENFLERSVLTSLISGVVAPWPEAKSQAFLGTSEGFSGVSTGTPKFGGLNIKAFSIDLEKRPEGLSVLVYDDGVSQFELARYSNGDPEFRYLTDENVWLRVWPPKKSTEQLRGLEAFALPQILPNSVKLLDKDQTLWIKSVSQSQNLPFRIEGNSDDY